MNWPWSEFSEKFNVFGNSFFFLFFLHETHNYRWWDIGLQLWHEDKLTIGRVTRRRQAKAETAECDERAKYHSFGVSVTAIIDNFDILKRFLTSSCPVSDNNSITKLLRKIRKLVEKILNLVKKLRIWLSTKFTSKRKKKGELVLYVPLKWVL